MRRRFDGLAVRILTLAAAGWLLQGGCITNVMREIEVLRSPAANAVLLGQSQIVDWFGPQILKFFGV